MMGRWRRVTRVRRVSGAETTDRDCNIRKVCQRLDINVVTFMYMR